MTDNNTVRSNGAAEFSGACNPTTETTSNRSPEWPTPSAGVPEQPHAAVFMPSVPAAPKGAGKATAALVCGIVAILMSTSCLGGIGFGIAAVVLAGQYHKLFGKDGNGKAKGGKICGIVGIVLGFFWGVFWVLMLSFGMWMITTAATYEAYQDVPAASQGPGSATKDNNASDDGDVITAGGIDAVSKYTFSVNAAVVGMEYSETPVVMLIGEFTNESDETVSFSGALKGTAMQNGYQLESSYLQGSAESSYENVAPGKTTPVIIGWELQDTESDVKITVADQYHYAEEVVYEESFTIDELIANSEAFASELDSYIAEQQGEAA